MSTLEDRKSAVMQPDALAQKTEAALASIEREKLKRERNGAMVGIAAGGFGTSASSGRLGMVIKALPIVMGGVFGALAVYALVLAFS